MDSANRLITQIKWFPQTSVHFLSWMRRLNPDYTFKPRKVNECLLSNYFKFILPGEFEFPGNLLRYTDPQDPNTVKREYRIEGTWVEVVNQCQWDLCEQLKIPPSQAETRVSVALLSKILLPRLMEYDPESTL